MTLTGKNYNSGWVGIEWPLSSRSILQYSIKILINAPTVAEQTPEWVDHFGSTLCSFIAE